MGRATPSPFEDFQEDSRLDRLGASDGEEQGDAVDTWSEICFFGGKIP